MNILIVVFLLLVGIAGSYGSGVIGCRLFYRKSQKASDMLLGFSLLPIFIAYAAFVRFFTIPWMSTTLAIVCCLFLFWKERNNLQKYIQFCRENPYLFAVPVVVLVTLAITKLQYFAGGTSTDGDDGRSILMIASFASNGLIPAHPYDSSLPILYPYYLFTTGAWLYAVINGVTFPTVPTYVLCLLTVGFSCLAFYRAMQLLENERPKAVCIFFFLILFSSGTLEILRSTILDLQFPLRDIGNFLLSGYHYLFGASIGLLGAIAAWRWIEDPSDSEMRTSAILYLTLSFAYSGITGVWIIFIAIPACVWLLISQRSVRLHHILASVGPALLIVGFTMLPQFANFLPGQFTIARFATTGTWLHRSVVPFLEERDIPLTMFSKTYTVILSLFGLFGPILFFIYFFAHIHAIRAIILRRITSASLLTVSLSFICIIMTFTVGNSHDWTARGLLAAIVWSAAFAAILFNEVTIDRPAWRKAGVVFAILLLPIGLYGQWRFRAHAPQPDMLKSMKEVHETYPLGTIFYNEDPKHSRMISVIPAAGRMLISFPPPSHIAYTNRVDVLEPLLNLRSVFEPCETTWYGKSTPQDTFVLISKDGVFQGALCQ